MSQYDFGVINPNTKNGATLATDLNNWRDALHSLHKANVRPDYAVNGTMWLDDSLDSCWLLKLYNGDHDVVIQEIDPNGEAALLPLHRGGTGAADAEGAREALELGALAVQSQVNSNLIEENAVTNEKVADHTLSLDKLAKGTPGDVIAYDTDGLPAATRFSANIENSRRCKKISKGNFGMSSHVVSVYLMEDGTIRGCGYGGNYSNGDPAGGNNYVPGRVALSHPGVNVVAVYSGHHSHYALDDEGNVYSWGLNDYGQLGHGDTTSRPVATRIEFFVQNDLKVVEVYTIGAGYYQYNTTIFRTDKGYLYACGYNGEGQLGDGTTANKSAPVRCGYLENIQQVHIGGGHPKCIHAINDEGQLWSWGWNATGQLGLGHNTNEDTPVRSSLRDVKKVLGASGYNVSAADPRGFSLAVKNDGTVWATGSNPYGQLGQGNTTDLNQWTQVHFPDGDTIVDIALGCGHYAPAMALNDQGEVLSWGYNGYGQLGNGVDDKAQSVPLKPEGEWQGKVTRIAIGGSISYSALIVESDGALWGCGYNGNMNLGVGDATHSHQSAHKCEFRRVLGLNGTMRDWWIHGHSGDWGIRVLYEDGRVDACGQNATYGFCGTQSGNLHNQGVLAQVRF
ncbi:RCC1 domain-containing protein [Vibrio quintilis]|uniref:Regulator of chromosome condensation (RCC1) repeat protein n=1 Tax=Vibrio quintilis TaxID=1117707 RepID=A0A1M7YZ22_9VIBR|nr:hypothetical protein [Vibrio quintilis]SHO57835.1 Regulator of chromosome condensation (RCC1) repeat protein [Vibrio quintilis]